MGKHTISIERWKGSVVRGSQVPSRSCLVWRESTDWTWKMRAIGTAPLWNGLTKVQNAKGFIDLTKVKYVRTVKRKPEGQDAGVGQGESVDFHAAELSTNDSEYAFEQGAVSEFEDERTFELVLDNDLVIRLQSFNLETRREWMRRLRDLIKYWKLRVDDDMQSLKDMRAQNLEMIKIDLGNESRFGDWIQQYQLVEAVSAPGMYHFCRLSNCRTISVFSASQLFVYIDAGVLVRQIPSSSNFP